MTLPATVREANRLNCWKIIPVRRRMGRTCRSGRVEMSTPSTTTVPEVTRSSPLIRRTRVLLPAPDWPMTAKISPASISRSTPSSAVTVLPSTSYDLVTPERRMSGGMRDQAPASFCFSI